MDKNQHIPQEQVEEIERFLLNEMTTEERKAFTVRMSADPELKQQINEMQFLFIGVQEASLEQRLHSFHKELAGDTTANIKSSGKLFSLQTWLAAASIIVVIAVSGWVLLFRTQNEQSLFADYFTPDPGLITAMTTSDNYLFDRAMIDYKTGNYEAAIKAWDSMQTAQPNNDTLNYFLGSAWLAKGEAGKAGEYLAKVTRSPTSVFLKDAYWYLALASIKVGDTKKAIPLLEKSDHLKKEPLLTRLKE